MSTEPKTEASKYGFDAYPLIARHPINGAITLRRHPNGPVIYDADNDTMATVLGHVLNAIHKDEAPTAGAFEANWIAMELFRAVVLEVGAVEKIREALEETKPYLCRCGACAKCVVWKKVCACLALLPSRGEATP